MNFDASPLTLEGDHVRLEPLGEAHAAGLFACGQVSEDWAYLPRACFASEADCLAWIRDSLTAPDQAPFAIIARGVERPVGSTRYLAIRPAHRGLEVGWTWLGRDWQRTAINTETKLLLLAHAFEVLGAIRVEFKTDARNLRSQAALERIGAQREGVLRQHMIVQGGYQRDSVYFSILDKEWPSVRHRLRCRLTPGAHGA